MCKRSLCLFHIWSLNPQTPLCLYGCFESEIITSEQNKSVYFIKFLIVFFIVFIFSRTITDSRHQSLLCAAIDAFTSTLHHSPTEPGLRRQENSGEVRHNTRATFTVWLNQSVCSVLLYEMNNTMSYFLFVSLSAVVAARGGNATRSHWSLSLHPRGPVPSSEGGVQRSCLRVKPLRSHGETEAERVPSPGDPVLPRTRQSQSAAESGSLVRHDTHTHSLWKDFFNIGNHVSYLIIEKILCLQTLLVLTGIYQFPHLCYLVLTVKPEPVVQIPDRPALSEEEVERKSKAIIDEFLHINDYKVWEYTTNQHDTSV